MGKISGQSYEQMLNRLDVRIKSHVPKTIIIMVKYCTMYVLENLLDVTIMCTCQYLTCISHGTVLCKRNMKIQKHVVYYVI